MKLLKCAAQQITQTMDEIQCGVLCYDIIGVISGFGTIITQVLKVVEYINPSACQSLVQAFFSGIKMLKLHSYQPADEKNEGSPRPL